MKKIMFMVYCFMAVWIGATITTPVNRGAGHMAGKMAAYASGDTIAFVYNDNTNADPSHISSIVYKYSYNGGTTWSSTAIDQVWDGFCNPSLSISPGEILVTFTQTNQRKLARSTNGGMTWAILNMGTTFEKSPRIERRGTEYHNFELDVPYSEYLQSSFATTDNPEELRAPQFVTDQELSWNQTPVYFHGADVVQGTVRSNSNIWIKQTTSGTNNGWPIFLDTVITSGVIQAPTAYNAASIFRGGLITNAPKIELDNVANEFSNWVNVGPATFDPNKIVLVTGFGESFTVHLGQLTNPHQITRQVYQQYPPGSSMLGTNTITVCDTVWTQLDGFNVHGGEYQVHNKLWIRGVFSGHHSWACHDSIWIVGNITLSGTPAGTAPDNPANPNLEDSVTLITMEKVLFKYGFKDPVSNQRVHPLCKADSNPSYIYASVIALKEDDDPRQDGTITFEYQHPHASIPAANYLGNLYTDIDLHRYFYPQTATVVWPAAVDLPWYNPLWPEAQPYMERGILQFWGSLYQRRRGYVHRNWLDPEYNTGNVWDPSIDACGGASYVNGTNPMDPILNIPIYPANYPGASGQGIGYKKDYRGDRRHEIDPKYFSWGIRLGSRAASAGVFTTNYLSKYCRKIHTRNYAKRGSAALYSVNDQAVFEMNGEFTNLSSVSGNGWLITGTAITADNHALLCQINPQDDQYALGLREIDPQDLAADWLMESVVPTTVNDIVVMPDGRKIFARLDNEGDNYLSFSQIREDGEIVLIENYPVTILGDDALTKESRIWLVPSSNTELEVFIWKKMAGGNSDNPFGTIYTAHAVMPPVAIDDPVAPVIPELHISTSPNPMRDELKLELTLPAESSYTIRIYNLRGQLVKCIAGISDTYGKAETRWNGSDEKGMPCAKGIYLLKLSSPGKADQIKPICRI